MVAIVAGVAMVLISTGVAQAAVVPGGSSPLTGSGFQGGDGNQDDEVPHVDWQGLQAAGAVVHSPDPNAADTAFVGGTKEDEPGSWALTTEAGGVNPAKANILDAWSAVDQPVADTFLYLGFTRRSATGLIRPANSDTFLAFELNQDARLWNNGHANIPCRRDGDVLVVFAAHGNSIDVTLEQWKTLATDPSTGCATRGQLTAVATIPAGSAQGDVNAAAITSRLPGFFPPSSTISESLFGEAALNLSTLLQMAFDDRCLAFASMWMHSRSSESESSNMQDYLAPKPLVIRTCAASGTKFFDRDANGRRDEGEQGLPRFFVWADYDNDGVRDANEPFAVTDDRGQYVIENIQPPGGSYRLRETLLSARRQVRRRYRLAVLLPERRHGRWVPRRAGRVVRLRVGADRARHHALRAGA